MKRVALAGVLFLCAVAYAADEKPRKLDGTYAVKAGEQDGEAIPAEELKKIVEVVIKDDLLTIKKDGSDDHKAKLRLDATKKPAEVDVIPQDGPEKDKTLLGIYKMEKDELTLVVAKEGDRPKDFDAKGKGIMKVVLQRKGDLDK